MSKHPSISFMNVWTDQGVVLIFRILDYALLHICSYGNIRTNYKSLRPVA